MPRRITLRGIGEAIVSFAFYRNAGPIKLNGHAPKKVLRWSHVTTCQLLTPRIEGQRRRLLGKAAVVCQPGDKFQKQTGRTLALREAIADAKRCAARRAA